MRLRILPAVARTGYVARAVLFVSIGSLTLLAASGSGGREAGFQEAVQTLLREPLGRLAALGLAIGLACFALWRFAEAFLPFDTRPKSILQRAAFGGSGLLYSGMALWTVTLAASGMGAAQGGSDQSARQWTQWIFGYSYGIVLILAVGAAFIITAIVIFVRAVKTGFKSSVALRPDAPAFIVGLGRYGLICRAIVFAELGGFLIYAALTFNSREAKGMEGAFRAIKQLDHGYILLAATAVGFIAFGLFDLGKAFYRSLNPREVAADP
jgi:hypothetical protein